LRVADPPTCLVCCVIRLAAGCYVDLPGSLKTAGVRAWGVQRTWSADQFQGFDRCFYVIRLAAGCYVIRLAAGCYVIRLVRDATVFWSVLGITAAESEDFDGDDRGQVSAFGALIFLGTGKFAGAGTGGTGG